MTKLLPAIALVLALAACSDGDTARRVLMQQGYTEIEITGWSPFSCSQDDTFSTGFQAKSPAGLRVTGTVCSAFFKGATIRFD